jgi:hypothetical protein
MCLTDKRMEGKESGFRGIGKKGFTFAPGKDEGGKRKKEGVKWKKN